jgi:para-nitrobenzyl esterase
MTRGSDHQATVVTETTAGRVRGLNTGSALAFRGVPYGDTTAGKNRFRAPQPAPEWSGIRDALRNGYSAPQLGSSLNTDSFYAWYSAIETTSEDCLVLNVFTPAVSGKRPVMVWIHGGGWTESSGTAPGFDGSNLAMSQDVVVVAINHRLNVLGFLNIEVADERFADSANAGMLDIVAALHWIKHNISAFGGDASNVTVFGQSGGASKIAALLAMPAAKGLFHKAALQSSAGGLTLASREQSVRKAAGFASSLGLSASDAASLQQIPVEKLLKAMGSTPGPFRASIDGRNFSFDPFETGSPLFEADIPILVGCTSTETTYHLRPDPKNFHLDLAEVQNRLMAFLDIDGEQAHELIDIYRTANPHFEPSDVLISLSSDQIYKRTSYHMAERLASFGSSNVFAYHYTRESPVENGLMRSPHTSEIPMIFGTLDTARDMIGVSGETAAISATIMRFWASFARDGKPQADNMPEWTPFTPADRMTMELNLECEMSSDPGGECRNALDDLPYFTYGPNSRRFATG